MQMDFMGMALEWNISLGSSLDPLEPLESLEKSPRGEPRGRRKFQKK